MARIISIGRPANHFSLVEVGPFYRLTQRLSRSRLALLLTLVAWVPLVLIALLEWSATRRVSAAFLDYALHARLLVALPLLVIAEQSMHRRTRRCIDRFVEGGWAQEGEAAVARVTGRAARLLAAATPEIVLLVLAVAGSEVVVWGWGESLGLVRGRATASGSTAFKAWHALVSLPLYQFLLYRWLWRWLIWSVLLWRLSRLRLRPLVAHPDLRGGMGFLSEPAVGFALIILAANVVQAAVWANQVAFHDVDPRSFKAELAISLVGAVVLSVGALLAFVHPLWEARFEGVRDYERLATDYTRLFHTRWVEREEREGLLGTPDIQSLADLANSYDVVKRMRVAPIELRTVAVIAAAVLAPMVPVALMRIPVMELVRKLGTIAVGGLPG